MLENVSAKSNLYPDCKIILKLFIQNSNAASSRPSFILFPSNAAKSEIYLALEIPVISYTVLQVFIKTLNINVFFTIVQCFSFCK
jgi:hypothetical protein